MLAVTDSIGLGMPSFLAAIGLTTMVLRNSHRTAPLPLAAAPAGGLALLCLVDTLSERSSAPVT